MVEDVEVVIIGGGQAGLALGYYLARHGSSFIILEAATEVGHSWRNRWDSLRLFTPSHRNNLPGLAFPAAPDYYPTKDEVADYLQQYAATFSLPISLGCTVIHLEYTNEDYKLQTSIGTLGVPQVVITTGAFGDPFIPAFSQQLSPDVFQVHSSEYLNPAQLPPGDTLVVGSGNSGMQIAEELIKERQVYLSKGQKNLEVPQRPLGRDFFDWLYMVGIMRITVDNPLGRRLSQSNPVIGTSLSKLSDAGVVVMERTQTAQDNHFIFADGREAQVNNVVWATGFYHDYQWIDAPIFDVEGTLIHERGVTPAPGLYFLGLAWQHTLCSGLLGGIQDDAAFIAQHILSHQTSR